MHSWAPLQVLHGDTDDLFPVSSVGSFSPAGGCFLTALSLHYGSEHRRGVWATSAGGSGGKGAGLRAEVLLRFGGTEALASLPAEPGYFQMPSSE